VWSLTQVIDTDAWCEVTMAGDAAAASNYFFSPEGDEQIGMVETYRRIGNTWVAQNQFTGTQDEQWFGSLLTMSADRLVVGSRSFNTPNHHPLIVYRRVASGWTPEASLLAIDLGPPAIESYGYSATIEGDRLASGNVRHWITQDYEGAVHRFERVGGIWQQAPTITSQAPQAGAGYGGSVQWVGPALAVGESGRDLQFFNQGQVVILAPPTDTLFADHFEAP
jgi:hypothetical protein